MACNQNIHRYIKAHMCLYLFLWFITITKPNAWIFEMPRHYTYILCTYISPPPLSTLPSLLCLMMMNQMVEKLYITSNNYEANPFLDMRHLASCPLCVWLFLHQSQKHIFCWFFVVDQSVPNNLTLEGKDDTHHYTT